MTPMHSGNAAGTLRPDWNRETAGMRAFLGISAPSGASNPPPATAPGLSGDSAQRSGQPADTPGDLACLADYLARVVRLAGFNLEAEFGNSASGQQEARVAAEPYRDALAAIWTVEESLKSLANRIDALPRPGG